jgi:sporulation protein YlmC with PRC-barrel domain
VMAAAALQYSRARLLAVVGSALRREHTEMAEESHRARISRGPHHSLHCGQRRGGLRMDSPRQRGFPRTGACKERYGLARTVPIGLKSATYRHRRNTFYMQDFKIKKSDPEKKFRRVLAASTLAGDRVRNSAQEDLGKVDEIMIDIPSGRVAYAVLSFGGILGMGNKLFAVPWSALKVDEDEKCFILDVNKKTLEGAPGFDKSQWPDMADTTWRAEVYRYYGATPYWQHDGETKTHRGGSGY